MKLYVIEDEYVQYLSQYDKLVAFNKGKKRPYVGIVFKINEMQYFAPLYSPKPQHSKYKENPSFIKIKEGELGIIRFSTMIPVPSECVKLLEFDKQEEKYKILLRQQIIYINQNEDKILKKANSLYRSVIGHTNLFLESISCDFKVLENKCNKFKK